MGLGEIRCKDVDWI